MNITDFTVDETVYDTIFDKEADAYVLRQYRVAEIDSPGVILAKSDGFDFYEDNLASIGKTPEEAWRLCASRIDAEIADITAAMSSLNKRRRELTRHEVQVINAIRAAKHAGRAT